MLLHVADASSPHVRGQIDAVNSVLAQIDCAKTETILVLNKTDAVSEAQGLDFNLLKHENVEAVPVSALRGEGLDRLRNEIRERARDNARPMSVSVHAGDGKMLAFMSTHFFEDSREMDGENVILHGRASQSVLEKLLTAGDTVKILKGWEPESDGFKRETFTFKGAR